MTPEVRPPGHGIRIPWERHSVDPSSGAKVCRSSFSYTTQFGDHFLASLLLGIVVTGGRDPGASTHHAPGAQIYAVVVPTPARLKVHTVRVGMVSPGE